MVEVLTYEYTSQTEIERILSATGSLYRADDDADGVAESGVWQDIVNEATDICNLYLLGWYVAESLVNNLMVRRWASYIGAFLLSGRRGNPPLYVETYERTIRFLEEVAAGRRRIPRVPMRDDFTPAMSNLRVDHRFRVSKVRVVPQISVGGNYGEQHLEPDYVYEYW